MSKQLMGQSLKGAVVAIALISAGLYDVPSCAFAGCFTAPPGLVGFWPADDGTARDVAGGNNGTLQGGASANAPGISGTAFSFDGTNSYVQIPDAPALHPTNLTIEAWVNFTSLNSADSGDPNPGDQYIVFKQNTQSSNFEGFDLSKTRINGNDVFRFLVSSASGGSIELHSASTVTTGVWYHVAGVRGPFFGGSDFLQLYVNGQLESYTNISFPQDYGSLPLFFGTSGQSYYDHKLKGMLDEVSLYNRALSPDEIVAIAQTGSSAKCKAVRFVTQPQSHSVILGSNALFSAAVTGLTPLSYRWQFTGINIAGATNSSLILTNVQGSNAGNYTVIGSNIFGSATSVVATLGVVAVTVAAPSSNSAAYTWTTFAGSPSAGSADGVASAAQFNGPEGVATDTNGNVYVTDSGNHTIRKITSAGVVSTIAGLAGSPGSADGTGNIARFDFPQGIAVGSRGSLYVADNHNETIRKITPVGTNWVVSTIAGLAGQAGSADDTNSTARFGTPAGLVADANDNIYVADPGNTEIRQITPIGTNWVVSTIAGSTNSGSSNGVGTAAQFITPNDIAMDKAGNLYVADTYNEASTIRKLTHVGTNWMVSSIPNGSIPDSGQAFGVAVDSASNVYYAGVVGVFKVTLVGTNWVVAAVAGGSFGSADGTGPDAQFRYPHGVAVDSVGNLYVADTQNNTIRYVTSAGVVSTTAGLAFGGGSVNGTGSGARFNAPAGAALDRAGNVYITDSRNDTIRKATSAAVVTTLAGSTTNAGSTDGIGSNARFNFGFILITGIAVDGADNIYVSDGGNDTVRRITPSGVVSTLAGLPGNAGAVDGSNSAARFNNPAGVAVDSTGNLFVADFGNNTIRRIILSGTNWIVDTIAGLAGNEGFADGTGSNARFIGPSGIAVDSATNLYVADYYNNTVRKITPVGTNWVVSTIAGLAGSSGSADGPFSIARFNFPEGIAVGGDGNVYVADAGSNTVRKITPAGSYGVVSTVGGLPGFSGAVDGAGSAARFSFPVGIAVDGAGDLYVADYNNNTIRKGVFTAYTATNPVNYTLPGMSNQLIVTLVPTNGQWRFPWELGWRNSDQTASNLVASNYTIEFRSLPGYLSPPQQVTVVGLTQVTNQYFPTFNDPGPSGRGAITVNMGLNPPPCAAWRFLGETDSDWRSSGSTATNLLPDIYFIEFKPVGTNCSVAPYSKPGNRAVRADAGATTAISVNYTLAQSPPPQVLLPFPVPSGQISNLTTYPFGFNGQLLSDVGYGSGVAVLQNVVLTAAHLVFNDQTLSYANDVWWFFQEEKGAFDPEPLPARGWYLLSSYSALGTNSYAVQRTNDLLGGLAPEQSSPQSRNLDVAALYFLSAVAGGGYGGYLPSDSVPNSWLTGTGLKMLVGYPVDGSLFGDASIVPGEMYQTDPQPYPLDLATDPVANQQVYKATWFLSYPGNSGGPLYVQFNGYYYPAAVYLGTLFNGAQPYASAVRAIDSAVVNLITNAALLGDTGTNAGGGVLTVIPDQGVNSVHYGLVKVHLAPPAAVQAGAAWKLQGLPDAAYSSNPNYGLAVTSPAPFSLQFRPIAGWNLPPDQTGTIGPDQTKTFDGLYTVTNPVLVVKNSLGLGIFGTPGSTYRIERRASIGTGGWVPLTTNTIISNGFNLLLPLPATNPSPSFYRAVWLQ